jgi:hypothetical protein
MKLNFVVAVFFAASAVACAQDRQERQDRQNRSHSGSQNGLQDQQKPRRLESVTWNSVRHQLTWVISDAEKRASDGSFKPGAETNYVIDMDKATMTFNGETRGFSQEEAKRVHVLMDLISKYAVESTVWWDDGHGRKLDPKGNSTGKPGEDEDDDALPTTKASLASATSSRNALLAVLTSFPVTKPKK